ncbi:MAG: hypothetical protein ACHQX3_11645 [Nitrospirales bacterium]
MSEEGGRGGAKVEIKPQQNIHPDQSGHEERLGSLSFGENYGVRSERGAPSRFFGLAEILTRLLDGVFDHINRNVECSRKLVDKPCVFFEIMREAAQAAAIRFSMQPSNSSMSGSLAMPYPGSCSLRLGVMSTVQSRHIRTRFRTLSDPRLAGKLSLAVVLWTSTESH